MIAFEPTEDQALMQREVAAFAAKLRDSMRAHEALRGLPEDVRRGAFERGLGGAADLPEGVGGMGLGLVTAVLLEEKVAQGDPAAAFAMGGPGHFGRAVVELATEAQAKVLLEPFVSDGAHARFGAVAWGERKPHPTRPGLVTRAERVGTGGYRLHGDKHFVLNAEVAARFVVLAQVDEEKGWDGLGAFVVERGAPGLTVGPRVSTLGLDLANVGSLHLDGVVVTEEARLVGGAGDFGASLVRFLAKTALVSAARALGLAQAAVDVTLEYVRTRKAFGKPVGHFQAVAFTVADRAMEVEAARSMVWSAAAAWDGGGDERAALLATAQAVAYVQEAAMRAGDDAVQLHGGAGFMRDYPVEKWMRDAKQLGVTVMTAEQADQLAACIELERPIDLGLVLPSAEGQCTLI